MKRIYLGLILWFGLFAVACDSTENCDLDAVIEEVREAVDVNNETLADYINDTTNVENCQKYKAAIDALITARTKLLDCNPTEDSRVETENNIAAAEQERGNLPCN